MTNVKILIDSREHKIIECMKVMMVKMEKIEKDMSISIDVKQLDIGDFHILVNDTLLYVIERKTVSDLESSIKDGRWSEQKSRATSMVALTSASASIVDVQDDQDINELETSEPRVLSLCPRIMYILENCASFDFDDSLQYSKMMSSAVLNTVLRDDCPFFFTKNANETTAFLLCLAKRAGKLLLSSLSSQSSQSKSQPTKSHTECLVATRKKDNVNDRTCFVMQLCCIPGISTKKAETILSSLNVASISQLTELMRSNSKVFEKTSGIGKTLSSNIYKFCGVAVL